MLLNMPIIYDGLIDLVVQKRIRPLRELTLSGVRILSLVSEDKISSKYVYIVGDNSVEQCDWFSMSSVIYTGNKDINSLGIPNSIDVLCIPGANNYEIMVKVLSLFEHYCEWNETLVDSLIAGDSAQKVLDIAARVLTHPVALCDITSSCVAWSGIFPDGYHDEIWDTLFKTNNTFHLERSKKFNDIHFFNIDERVRLLDSKVSGIGHDAVVIRIFSSVMNRKEGIGFLGSTGVWGNISDGQLSLLNEIGRCFESFPQILENSQNDDRIAFIFRKILLREVIGSSAKYYINNFFSDKKDKTFRIIVMDINKIIMESNNLKHMVPEYFRRTIKEKSDNDEIVLLFDDYLIVFSGKLYTQELVQKKYNYISELFKPMKAVMKIGVSEVFEDFNMARCFFKQAVNGLTLGQKKDPDDCIFYFHNYALEYIFEEVENERMPSVFCDLMAYKLYCYDKKYHTEYLRTMERYYYFLGNKVKTADALFIHRNSLEYRLDKIKDILEINSFSMDEPLYFLLSCRVLQWWDKKTEHCDDKAES